MMSLLGSKKSNTSKPKNNGFITFEGGDGAGKTTLVDRLFATLQARGTSVIKTRAPGATEVGQHIRRLLLDSAEPLAPLTELFLFLADRAEHVEKVILPALAAGKLVLCDRFNDSTIAYQGARGFATHQLEELCALATKGLEPALTLYLDIDPKLGLQRCLAKKGQADLIEREDITFHQAIRAAFLARGKKRGASFQIVDASQSMEKVYEQALHLIDVHCFATPSSF